MRKRRIYLALVGLGILIGGIVVFSKADREPEYGGEKLSKWVMYLEVDNPVTVFQARAAVLHLGTNALPYLVEWIQYETPYWKAAASYAVRKLVGREIEFRSEEEKHVRTRGAADAFRYLDAEAAAAAIPYLARLINEPGGLGTAERAIRALGYVGKPALPVLELVVTNQNAVALRYHAAWAISESGTNARPAVPALLQLLNDTDSEVREAATNALRRIDPNVLEKAPAP